MSGCFIKLFGQKSLTRGCMLKFSLMRHRDLIDLFLKHFYVFLIYLKLSHAIWRLASIFLNHSLITSLIILLLGTCSSNTTLISNLLHLLLLLWIKCSLSKCLIIFIFYFIILWPLEVIFLLIFFIKIARKCIVPFLFWLFCCESLEAIGARLLGRLQQGWIVLGYHACIRNGLVFAAYCWLLESNSVFTMHMLFKLSFWFHFGKSMLFCWILTVIKACYGSKASGTHLAFLKLTTKTNTFTST